MPSFACMLLVPVSTLAIDSGDQVDFENLSGIPGRVATLVGVFFEGIFCLATSHRLCKKPQRWRECGVAGLTCCYFSWLFGLTSGDGVAGSRPVVTQAATNETVRSMLMETGASKGDFDKQVQHPQTQVPQYSSQSPISSFFHPSKNIHHPLQMLK